MSSLDIDQLLRLAAVRAADPQRRDADADRLLMFLIRHTHDSDEADDDDDPEDTADADAEALLRAYRHKLIGEAQARAAGRWVEADFLLRQLSLIELALITHEVSLARIATAITDHVLPDAVAPPLRALEALRRHVWAQTDVLPRPALPDPGAPCPTLHLLARNAHLIRAARADAERRIAQAQRDWRDADALRWTAEPED